MADDGKYKKLFEFLIKNGPQKTLQIYRQAALESGFTPEGTKKDKNIALHLLLNLDPSQQDASFGFRTQSLIEMLPEIADRLPNVQMGGSSKGGRRSAAGAATEAAPSKQSAPKDPMAEMMAMASSVDLGQAAPLQETAKAVGQVTLPETIPLSTFKQMATTPEQMESLSPGIIEKTYKYIVPGPDGTPHVRIENRTLDNPEGQFGQMALQLSEEHKVAMMAQQATSMGDTYRPKLVPLGTLMRQYGPDTINTMFPGILAAGGYAPFMEKYGTDSEGRLLVPSLDDAVTSAPPTQEMP